MKKQITLKDLLLDLKSLEDSRSLSIEIFKGHHFSLLFQLVLKIKFKIVGNSFLIMKICLNASTTRWAS